MTDALDAPGHSGHVLTDLGFDVREHDEGLAGRAEVLPEMYVPGTECLRTSIFACWADVAMGLVCIDVFDRRVPVTLDLTIDLPRPAAGLQVVEALARVVKVGRSIALTEIDFYADGGDELVATGTASFAAAPDPGLLLPPKQDRITLVSRQQGRLRAPFAERAGCEYREPGVVCLPRREDGLNASDTINGGLIALVAEESVLSAQPGATLCTLALRYLRPARIGPIVGTAGTSHGDLSRVEVRDTGADDRLVVLATARRFGKDAY